MFTFRTALAALVALLVIASAAPAQPYTADTRTLLLDHLDDTFAPDGKACTRPAKATATGELTGGRPTGGRFAPGRFGGALEMHGLMQMTYPAAGNINLSAGAADFRVALHFDAAEKIKNPGVLSNQMFLTVWGSGSSMVSVYSTLGHTCAAVWDRNRQIVCYTSFPGFWKKGEWHHLELRWGRALELWCDGRKQSSQEWAGLFGPVDVKPADVRLTFGSHVGWSNVESEYALDEVRIQGPGGEQVPDSPAMTVCRMKAPAVDGTIAESEWAGVARTTGFVRLNEHVLADEQTVVYAGWDDEALYLAYECLNPTKRELVARLKERDSGVFMEDAVDFLCRPAPDAFPYYQFICSAIGTVYDSRVDPRQPASSDLKFNPNCLFRTGRQADRWTMECKIPFAELDGRPRPKDGDRWRVNFCRDGETMNRYSSWAYADGNFHGLDNFGDILFSTADRAIRLGPLGDLAMGKVEAQLALTGFLFDPLVIVKGELVGADAKTLSEQENRLADYRAVTVKAPPLVTGAYNLTLRAATAKETMYYQRLPFRVMKAYDVAVEGYPYEGKLWVTANVAGIANPPKGLTARTRLMQGDKMVAECSAASFTAGLGEGSIDVGNLAPGKYLVKSEAVAPDGKVLGTAEAQFEQFARPKWWKNRIGIDHTVPKPFEPVRSDGKTLRVWGREYRCGKGALPKQILNQGAEILAGPVSLKMAAGGATVDLAGLPATGAGAAPDAVQRVSRGTVGSVKVQLRTTTEFDGLQRCDLTLTPAGAAEVSSLVLEIPVKREYAAFLCPSNGMSSPSLLVPKEGWKSAFVPQVWVGNDDVGFAWCAESDEFWQPRDDGMLEVRPAGERTLIRANLIRRPLRLEKPVTYAFALIATPVKDAHAGDPFWVRFGEGEGKQMCMELCRYPGAGNVDLKQGTLELWLSPLRDMEGTWRQVAAIVGAGGDLQMYYLPREQTMNVLLTQGQHKVSMSARGLQMRPGQFTHVALTWGDVTELYVDGRRCAAVAGGLPAVWAAEPAKFGVRLGCPRDWQGYTRIAVDDLRISKAIRYQGDTYTVPAGPFQPDAQTLLLDHFDDAFTPDGEDGETRAAVVSGQSGELGGVPSLGCRFGEGKFGAGLQIAMLDPMPRKDAVKRWGFNAKLHWFWLESDGSKYGWPSPLMTEPEVANLRETLKEDTALGLRPSTYMGYPAVGSPSPLSAQFGHEWSRQPLSTQPYEPPKGHYFWDVCARSGYTDYMAAGAQWMLDDLGFTGLYTDGCAQAYACRNRHHGCGWVDEKGRVHSTWPVFATREMLKRMYRLIHAKNADGYLVNHMSFNTLIPTMAFTDVHYSGEHEQYEELTRFRVRWQGKQWGFWTVLLGGDAHIYEPLHMAWCLLHGVSVWPQGWQDRNDASRKTANLWQAYDRFGYRQAEWIPYYRAGALAKPDSEKVKVSLYRRKGQRALLVIANTEAKVTEAKVSLDLAGLGLKKLSARDALTGRPLPARGKAVPVRLRPSSFMLVWVE